MPFDEMLQAKSGLETRVDAAYRLIQLGIQNAWRRNDCHGSARPFRDGLLRPRPHHHFERPTPKSDPSQRGPTRSDLATTNPRVQSDAKPKGPQPARVNAATIESRESRLCTFVREHRTTYATVADSAPVAKVDLRRWRKGVHPDSSAVSISIENVLSGRTRLLTRDEREPFLMKRRKNRKQ
jgi:hypothetical protein